MIELRGFSVLARQQDIMQNKIAFRIELATCGRPRTTAPITNKLKRISTWLPPNR